MITALDLSRHGITLPAERIAEVCKRWRIRALAVFGSFLRDDYANESDIDLLYSFQDGVKCSLDEYETIERELSDPFGRPVDLIRRKDIERSPNDIIRKHILSAAESIYVEG